MLHFFQTHLLSNTVTAWAATFNRGQLHRIIYRALLGVLTLARDIQLAIVNKMTQVLIGDIHLRQQCDVFCSAIPSVPLILARICNWSNYRHDWLDKRERFFTHQSRCESGKYPFKKITYQDWLQFFEHRRWVSIFMFWIKQRRIISRREKPMRPFQAYFNMHSSVSSAFSSKWVGIQFPKYITLFLLKHIPPITTC